MKKNIIILTTGLSGSSVMTAFIAQAGYWTGEETAKKRFYDTFENNALIQLDEKLIAEADFSGRYTLEFSQPSIDKIATLATQYEAEKLQAFADFTRTCQQQAPWIWKDPRLWLTIRFWQQFLPVETTQFVVLTRGHLESWVSEILKRQISSYGYRKRYRNQIHASILQFLTQQGYQYVEIQYEQLILNPVPTIEKLNQAMDLSLTVDDLQRIYKNDLYKKTKNSWDLLNAMMIYLKNYRNRFH